MQVCRKGFTRWHLRRLMGNKEARNQALASKKEKAGKETRIMTKGWKITKHTSKQELSGKANK